MTTRISVDLRPEWFQLMEAPVSSGAVSERMELLAKLALRQFVHSLEVRVLAIEDGFTRELVRFRGINPGLRRSCPHCGGFL